MSEEDVVREKADALKVVLAGVETRFREGASSAWRGINAHTAATNAQTALLDALCPR